MMSTKLTHLEAIEMQVVAIQETQAEHGEALRMIRVDLARIIDILSPAVTDGPTLDEILAQLVVQVGLQGVVLNRIDGRTVEIKVLVGGADDAEAGNASVSGLTETLSRTNGKGPHA